MTLKKFVGALFLCGGTLVLLPGVSARADVTNAVAAKAGTNSAVVISSPANSATNAHSGGTVDKDMDANADKAWANVLSSTKPPAPPATLPSDEEREKYNASLRQGLLNAIQNVKDFRAKYPEYKAAEAADMEKKLTGAAYQLGILSPIAKAPEKSEAEMIAEYSAMEEKVQKRMAEIYQKAAQKQPQGTEAVLKEMEDGMRALVQEFPEDDEVKREITGIMSARGLLARLGAVGKPFQLKLTALDGRQVDTAKLKGKVILIDFWATWCMPCLMEIPHIREAYDKFHEKGFEVVSISLDDDKEALTSFIAEKKIPWSQCFNADYHLAEAYGISGIPVMWLIDKNGNLRALNARLGLVDKVEKMLAE